MRPHARLGIAVALFAALGTLAAARDARACGACFGPPTESTQVSGHRMILSVSKQQTTLYDQIEYSGNPSSFAWVLPIRGQVEVGLSSDLLFQLLDQTSARQIVGPNPNCPPPPGDCNFAPGASADGSGGSGGSGGVTVLSQATVGPYETVQLASTDPNALNSWLDQNGYAVPPDLDPVIAAYLSEGFDFLALKLVPGQGVSAMRPVSVTSTGATPSLPLRMVAGGTGAKVPILLFVVGEAPWEPANFASFRVDASQLVWDWGQGRSNYTEVVGAGLAANQGRTWLYESSTALSPYAFGQQLDGVITYQESDYGPPTYMSGADGGADTRALADADVATLFAGMSPTAVRLTRLRAELPRAALAKDLELRTPVDTSEVPTTLQVTQSVGAPSCPSYDYCGGGAGGAPGLGTVDPIAIAFGGDANGDGGSASCALGSRRAGAGGGAAPVAGSFGIALALALLARRRRG